jgi:hypothetical protein
MLASDGASWASRKARPLPGGNTLLTRKRDRRAECDERAHDHPILAMIASVPMSRG